MSRKDYTRPASTSSQLRIPPELRPQDVPRFKIETIIPKAKSTDSLKFANTITSSNFLTTPNIRSSSHSSGGSSGSNVFLASAVSGSNSESNTPVKFKHSNPELDLNQDRQRLVDRFYNSNSVGDEDENFGYYTDQYLNTDDISIVEEKNDLISKGIDEGVGAVREKNIKDEVIKLEERIKYSIRRQVDVKEMELNEDELKFKSILKDIENFKLVLTKHIEDILVNTKSLEMNYKEFKTNYDLILHNLVNLEKYEEILNNSRTKLQESKKKLENFEKILEFGEEMEKIKSLKVKSRNKWMYVAFIAFVVLVILKLSIF